MKKLFATFILAILTVITQSQEKSDWKFYVGTFTNEGAKGIYLCKMDPATGEISLEKTFPAIDNPSFLKVSDNKQNLYVASRSPAKVEPDGGYVQAYKILPDGNLRFLNKQNSNGADPCFVDVSKSGDFVAVANYGGGTISMYPVLPAGELKPAVSVVVNKGSGPDQSRQSKPHAHSIKFSPFNNMVYSADLGTDQLDVFYLENGALIQKEQRFVKLDPGSGPRHFDFHPEGKIIYVINELSSTITVLEQKKESWQKRQVISILPKGFKEPNYCADIHITADGNFVYGSNRGHNSIVTFSVDKKSKKLKYTGFISTEGDWPRNFSLSPDENYILVANQKSGNITVFKRNKNTGMPEYTGKEIKLPSPVCIEFL